MLGYWLRSNLDDRIYHDGMFYYHWHRLVEPVLIRLWGAGLLTVVLLILVPTVAAQQAAPEITSPTHGQAVQGVISITGSTNADGFVSAELDFSYADDATGTWFLIAALERPVDGGLLAEWDTLSLTDATYILRLRVFLNDGSVLDTRITDVRVRNYTPIETPTLQILGTSTYSNETPTPAPPTETPLPYPTPTLLPPNPAAVTTDSVFTVMRRGALYAGVLVMIFSLLMRWRRK